MNQTVQPTVDPWKDLNKAQQNIQDKEMSKRDTIAMHLMAALIPDAPDIDFAKSIADRAVILTEALMERLRRP